MTISHLDHARVAHGIVALDGGHEAGLSVGALTGSGSVSWTLLAGANAWAGIAPWSWGGGGGGAEEDGQYKNACEVQGAPLEREHVLLKRVEFVEDVIQALVHLVEAVGDVVSADEQLFNGFIEWFWGERIPVVGH